MSDELLSLKQAADYLGVHRVKMGQFAKEGTIPYVTSPYDKRVKLFRRADLDELKQAPRPPASTLGTKGDANGADTRPR